jgi:hypothetical protein
MGIRPRWIALLAVGLVGTLISGCTSLPTVQPWERGQLARWDMQWEPDPLEAAMAEQIFFSKEGTAGKLGAAGGGCGCN